MNYTIESIADFCDGERHIAFPGSKVGRINIDHRTMQRSDALFAALKGNRVDGHDFIPELIGQKVHHFLISDASMAEQFVGQANFIVVTDVVGALQRIAAEHRDNFQLPVMAITGSNGKTVIKEWLNSLLEDEFQICRSPKSYNSQIGVPMSVFELNNNHNLAIFEAGISRPGEMTQLQQILRPTIGLFTNLGDAHGAHFTSEKDKFKEKWMLFQHSGKVVTCADQHWFKWLAADEKARCSAWSLKGNEAPIQFVVRQQDDDGTSFEVTTKEGAWRFNIPFTDRISVENACHCFAMCLNLDKVNARVLERFGELTPIAMRMEVKQGLEDSLIIDDTYNADLHSLRASVDQLATHTDREKWVILSDLKDSESASRTYLEIAALLKEAEVSQLIAIGPELAMHKASFDPIRVQCFDSTEEFWAQLDPASLRRKAVLVKGARRFRLEKLVNRLQAKQRITTLEIDLQKLGENLNFFRSKLQPETKIMVMVKAFAYGSGSYEVAHFFQVHRTADYLVVAYADEGIILREKGINLPIMVMSPSKTSYESMIQHNLEPEIYSLTALHDFMRAARGLRHLFEHVSIHLKLDTGMHRLGFELHDLNQALEVIKDTSFIRVQSVFTHLSASEAEEHDAFTRTQIERFGQMNKVIVDALGHQPDRHVLNSTGVLRFPQYHFEMVRLGIGLYGFSGSQDARFLSALGRLKSYIVQIREVEAGESIGYARKGTADHKRTIATVALGYADGLDRRLGNGNWNIWWQGTACPIVGSICMDMCMIDVTGTMAREGDEVIIFEGSGSIQAMADKLETIPYEILTRIPERVRRVYLHE